MVKNSCPEVCSEMQWHDFIPKGRMEREEGRSLGWNVNVWECSSVQWWITQLQWRHTSSWSFKASWWGIREDAVGDDNDRKNRIYKNVEIMSQYKNDDWKKNNNDRLIDRQQPREWKIKLKVLIIISGWRTRQNVDLTEDQNWRGEASDSNQFVSEWIKQQNQEWMATVHN